MAITSTGLNAATSAEYVAPSTAKDNTVLDKDDFMTLLLVELQHQDPTEPMDSEKILSQTSQLATLEASENTNKALSDLAASLGMSQQFSTISAIGKTADIGSNAVVFEEGSATTFEMYFPDDVQQGNIEITDVNGNVLKTLDVGTNPKGVYKFTWDGTDSGGNTLDSGIYYASASYTNPSGTSLKSRVGAYPIESVRFENNETLVKVGSSYVPLSKIVEVY
ncbi:MAG: flagellar hook capping protein [Sulfurimonas sp. RIFCSPHIGHO2_12_FULL_36_9]|uniref:FlgD immunoglobulin-like domain containing protein n=1 Tax=unclassified Sulfurimonas TaxID=2623549 RepID=UPI0008C24A1D|nr:MULTISPECIES: FlgD immunoglobulin-like domain containing protein [unclassified Sulfurimonas]OHD96212.1 MAG: flagellar hook capping protein [Sulfurimonas sp. RIFCSPHIGHO2_12_FULL_36_9]OHD98193.1 MAG: flagellar hook capping protein [Sulfurimonas sp. RIFCSPLOWO2_02_FULL_36_28]OHE00665.1 MAG: flagellar hook capping protein [Sulfurimonas sp. RIFCSPLOWO2_12_36_12]OHE03986.1 MAG: flagellar hook capping protein [Sulfurimonas sp. RIFCSPLOWO2_12_FULL_36_74]